MKRVGRFASEVYRIINANSHITAGEAFAIYRVNHPDTIRSRNEVAKRLSDLQKLGLVQKVGTTVCSFTDAPATTWEITGLDSGVIFSNANPEGETQESVESAYAAPVVNAFGNPSPDEEDDDDDCPSVTSEEPACCSCGCCDEDCDDESEETYPVQLHEMSRSEKADEITRLSGERCEAVDPEDLAILRQFRQVIESLDNRPFMKLLGKSLGVMGQVEKIRKALRYF